MPLVLALGLGPLACAYSPKTIVGEPPAQFASKVMPVPITYSSFRNDGATIEGMSLDCSNTFFQVSSFADRCAKDTSDDFEILRAGKVVWSVDCSAKLDPVRKPAAHLVCTYKPKEPSAGAMTLALAASSTAALSGMYVAKTAWSVQARPLSRKASDARYVVRRAGRGEPVLILGATSDRGVIRTTAFMAPELTAEEQLELTPLIFTLMQMRDPRRKTSPRPEDRTEDRTEYRTDSSNQVGLDIVDGKLGVRASTTSKRCQFVESKVTPLPSARPNMNIHAQHALQMLQAGRTEAARALWYVLGEG